MLCSIHPNTKSGKPGIQLLPFIFLTSIWVMPVFSQVRIDARYYSDYHNTTESINSFPIYIYGADSTAKDFVEGIMEFMDIPPNFKLKLGNVESVVAVIHDDQRYIICNKDFIMNLAESPERDWVAMAMLIHEIGHHILGHSLAKGNHAFEKDLMADELTGMVLAKMGASISESLAALRESQASDQRIHTSNHRARMQAVSKGWNKANGRYSSPLYVANANARFIGGGSRGMGPKKAKGEFQIHDSWIEHQVFEGSEKGMRIHVNFETSDLKGEKGKLSAVFFHFSGNPLLDEDYKYATHAGQVAVSGAFVSNSRSDRFADFVLFIPYSQLHISSSYQQKLKMMLFLANGKKTVSLKGGVQDFWYKAKRSGDLKSNSLGDDLINARLSRRKLPSQTLRRRVIHRPAPVIERMPMNWDFDSW